MAAIVNAQYSTIIGTVPQIQEFLKRLCGDGPKIVNLEYSNWYILPSVGDTMRGLGQALRTTPETTT